MKGSGFVMEFRTADRNDLEACARILEQAFAGDSFFEAFAPPDERRRAFFRTLMRSWMKISLHHERVFVAIQNETLVGVASLAPPDGKKAGALEYLRAGGLGVARACGVKNALALCRLDERVNGPCDSLPEPRWYLSLLAVSPAAKGQGVGSALLQSCLLPYVKSRGGGVFTLNTNEERNRRFYIKNGFEEFCAETFCPNGIPVGSWSYRRTL